MNWYHSPKTLEALAAAYALGTLSGPARRRFEAVLKTQPRAAQAVAQWNLRLQPLAQRLPPATPAMDLWARIERQTLPAARRGEAGLAPPSAAAVPPRPAPTPPKAPLASPAAAAPTRARAHPPARPVQVPAWRRWLEALLAPAPAAALAFGMAFGLALPMVGHWLKPPAALDTELPESYVGVLATAQGKPGLIVSSLRRGKVMDIKRVLAVDVPAGKTLYLWTLDAQGRPSAVGALPSGPFVRVPLPEEAETLFNKAVELAVSLEDPGATPAAPAEAFVYRGLCGKLWRVPPAAPAVAASASKP